MTAPLTAATVAFVNAVGALLIAFNVVLTQDQLAAVVGVVNTGIALSALMIHLVSAKSAKPVLSPPTGS